MFTFPKIRQFRDVIREVKARATYVGRDEDGMPIYNSDAVLPTLFFMGTVKLHGTNSSVVIKPDGIIQAQSRKRVLTIDSDNFGFARFVHEEVGHKVWLEIAEYIKEVYPNVEFESDDSLVVYGEWCGGGIQKGVALSELDKMFVVFGLRIIRGGEEAEDDEREWIDGSTPVSSIPFEMFDERIRHIHGFPGFSMFINFEKPGENVNQMVEWTNGVESECPVGKHFGVSGTGEGIVWRCYTPGYTSSRFWFKVKGEKHSVSKVKTLAPIDTEKMASLEEFVERTVTEQRLLQGVDHLREMGKELSRKSTGDFLRWVFNDIADEESDTMEASCLTQKDIGKPISTKARRWFFAYLDKDLF
jgi:hypothetical protein